MARVLVIDDNDTLREGAVAVIERMGHETRQANNGSDGVDVVTDSSSIDMVLTDLKMDGLDGLEVLARVQAADADIPVVIMTAFGTIENAVSALKKGAFDYVQKPFSPATLRHRLERALEWRDQRRTRARLEATRDVLSGARDRVTRHDGPDGFEGMVGSSPAIHRVFRTIEKVAVSNTAVAIAGESGTGKELVARAIHQRSDRAEGPFITVNCGAIPENLMESELFGHERGAFTGAVKRKLGRFELADGGTMFLDEVGELPLAMQVKLLRVLQERVIDRVGGENPIPVNIRIVSATNRRLADEVEAGLFREDLFYRLQVVPIELPPLRERTEDIVLLARHFVRTMKQRVNPDVEGLTPDAEQALTSYHFPGNVRELVNVVEQAMVFAEGRLIERSDLPSHVAGQRSDAGLDDPALPRRGKQGLVEFLESVERREILEAYERAGGVKTETARLLGIKTSALYYKLEKYGVGSIAKRDDDR